MAIQKKSLISNRTATKKALVTKPQVSKVAPTRFRLEKTRMRVEVPGMRLKVPIAD